MILRHETMMLESHEAECNAIERQRLNHYDCHGNAAAAAAAAAANKMNGAEDGNNDGYDSTDQFQRINARSWRMSSTDAVPANDGFRT